MSRDATPADVLAGRVPSDLAVGTAAEHLVCADLLLGGWHAFIAGQNSEYDVAVDLDGFLVRIQVKGTRQARIIKGSRALHAAYMFHVRRAGKHGARVYREGAFDLLALVALDTKRIAYLPPSKLRQTIHIRSHDDAGPINGRGLGGKTFAMFPFSAAIRSLRDARAGQLPMFPVAGK